MNKQRINYRQPFIKNYFISVGPFIASLLTILLGHLIGWTTSDHFGESTTIKNVIGMIILAIPFTVCAYIVGLVPAIITRNIFSLLINRYLKLHSSISRTRFLGYGFISTLFWLILPLSLSFIIEIKPLLLLSLTVFSILIPTTIMCTWLEWRYYQQQIKILNQCFNEGHPEIL